MTYMDLYISALEARIERGGKQEDVEKAVAEYNAFDKDAFKTWVEKIGKVTCAQCGDAFTPTPANPRDEVLCPEHKS